jgi:hypothetical protein
LNRRYSFNTRAGTFHIVNRKGRFHIIFREEDLGSYATPEQAADDLAGGHTFSPSSGVDPGSLGIPGDLSEWEQ